MKWYPTDSTESCVVNNTAGFPYEEFTCLYPAFGKFTADWEARYSPVPVRDWMVGVSPWFPVVACLLYGTLIVVGQSYFRNREPWNCRRALAVWNLGLSAFSFVGVVRVVPHIVHLFSNYTWQENFCFDPESNFGSGSTGLWVQLFILSKFPELFDTFFIVVHKKKLIFLHWYHHISVLLYCWHSYVTKAPAGIVFCGMNYAVHALMYFYYFLMAVKAKPKWLSAFWITLAQISQMVVGVAVTVLGFVASRRHEGCKLKKENNVAAFVMYGSYLFLFVEFFVQRYFTKQQKKHAAAVAAAKQQKKLENGTTISMKNGHAAPTAARKNRRKED